MDAFLKEIDEGVRTFVRNGKKVPEFLPWAIHRKLLKKRIVESKSVYESSKIS